jgi:SulP family sulfate permease
VFRPHSEHADDETFPGLLMVRTEGRLFFANISWVIDKLWSMVHQFSPKVLILNCNAIPDITYTAMKSLSQFERQLYEDGISLWLAGLNAEALYIIERSPLGNKLGKERIFLNLEQAVETYLQHLDQEVSDL